MEFLTENRAILIIILAALIGTLIAIKLGYESKVKQALLYFTIKAEKMFGGKTGEIKFAAVASWIYEQLPPLGRLLISADRIAFLINWGVDEMKKYLQNNPSATEYVKTKQGAAE